MGREVSWQRFFPASAALTSRACPPPKTGRLLLIFVASIAFAFGANSANAGSLEWSADGTTPGGTGIWNTSTARWFNGSTFQNWDNATLDDAVFDGTTGTVMLAVPITANSLTFNFSFDFTSASIVTGNTLTLGGISPFVSVAPIWSATIASVLDGAAGVTKTNDGTLILTGANTYTGVTTIDVGTLQLGNGGATGSILDDVVDNGTFAINRSDIFTFDSLISGTGGFVQNGTGTTVFTADHTYTGGTTIDAGTLQLGNGGATGSVVGDIVNNSALIFNRTGSYDGVVSGSGSLTKVGAGTFTLSGANTYTGVTTIGAGTLQAGATNAFAPSSAHTVASGAFMDLFGFNQTIGSLAGAGTVTNAGAAAAALTTGGNATSTTFSGIIQDGVGVTGLTKVGAGTFTLSGANTYTGVTTIGAGTLQAGATNAFAPSSAHTVASGAFMDLFGFNQTIGSLAGAGTVTNAGAAAAALTTGGNATSTTFSGIIQDGVGVTGLTKVGAGTFTLSGANTYTGVTTIGAGTLQAGATNAFAPSSAHTVASGAFMDLFGFNQTIGSLAGAGTVTNAGAAAAALTTGGNATSTTFSGIIQDGVGVTGLTKVGAGTFTLSGANTYTGVTTISAGTLQAGATNAFAPSSAHTVASGAFMDLFGFNQTIGSLAGAGTVTNAGAAAAALTTGGNATSTTFSGIIQDGVGVTGLTKVGAGTFTLSGANTYTGVTTISAGTLRAGATNAFAPSSAHTVASGAFMDLPGFNQTIGSLAGAGTVTNAGAAAAALTTGGNATSTTFSGIIQDGVGVTGLTKVGAGTFTLSGANTYSRA